MAQKHEMQDELIIKWMTDISKEIGTISGKIDSIGREIKEIKEGNVQRDRTLQEIDKSLAVQKNEIVELIGKVDRLEIMKR